MGVTTKPNSNAEENETDWAAKLKLDNDKVVQTFVCKSNKLVGTLIVLESNIAFYFKAFGKKVSQITPKASVTFVGMTQEDPTAKKKKKSDNEFPVEHGLMVIETDKCTEYYFKSREEEKKAEVLIKNMTGCKSADAAIVDRLINANSKKLSVANRRLCRQKTGLDLTNEDWIMLMQEVSERVTYKPGETIIKRGEITQTLFQISRGSCCVVLGEQRLGYIQSGEIFGVISFLLGSIATASVVADYETTVLHIERSKLDALFESKPPSIAAGFYAFLATNLRNLFMKVEGKLYTPPSANTKSKVTIQSGGMQCHACGGKIEATSSHIKMKGKSYHQVCADDAMRNT